jgi:RNA polymerase sigma-70 factor (ECF subfamily)|nr:sigma-70 family RNA polymerase sigma factor [Kofleriaceae bacterium]
MTAEPTMWNIVAMRLRPFVARRVDANDVDDIIQDVLVRVHRGLPELRDEDRFTSWLFQIARNSVAEHLRARGRHPVPDELVEDERPCADDGDDREASRTLSRCVAMFVAQLPSPYREAVTLVELEGLTAREAAAMARISVSGMKSRVQRGRAHLRQMFDACCEVALDARGKVTDFVPRAQACSSCGDPDSISSPGCASR